MTVLPRVSGRELVAALTKVGYRKDRQKGSHIVLLRNYLAHRATGRVYPAPVDVVLSQVDVVQPDLVFVSNDRLHLVTETSIQGAPDLVVEILSPSTARLDRGRKMDAYARFGVREYWIADTTPARSRSTDWKARIFA